MNTTPNDLEAFLRLALEPQAGQRRGQAFVNALTTVRAALVSDMIRLDLDPFYNDAKLPAAVAYTAAHWDEDEFVKKNCQK